MSYIGILPYCVIMPSSFGTAACSVETFNYTSNLIRYNLLHNVTAIPQPNGLFNFFSKKIKNFSYFNERFRANTTTKFLLATLEYIHASEHFQKICWKKFPVTIVSSLMQRSMYHLVLAGLILSALFYFDIDYMNI